MQPLSDLARHSQLRLGAALRARVAGDDAAERAQVIWGRQGERWFTPEDPVWRVHADAAMFPGGVAALLLQSLHPLAMAGVAGHSGYKGDPWGRLQRTSHFLATTTFGTVEDAEAAIERVRGIHERVRGHDPTGRPYRASDPRLLRWVHVAEAHSFLTAHQRYAVEPLTAAEADTLRRAVVAGRRPARGHRPARRRSPSSMRRSRPTGPSSRRPTRPGRPPGSCCSTRPCHGWHGPATG